MINFRFKYILMYTVYFGVDAVNFMNSVYRVNEREGFLESRLILDKPAKSNLEVSVINFDNNANGELFTILCNWVWQKPASMHTLTNSY